MKYDLRSLGLLLALSLVPACAVEPAAEDDSDSTNEAIVNGTVASSYPEAALIDTSTFLCSGSVIAPRVVLTAGHCIDNAKSWTVKTPFAGNQTAVAHKAYTSYRGTGESVDPDSIDVAVLVLDTPITLSSYPKLASAPVKNGTKGINVGRIKNDKVSNTQLFKGASVTLTDATSEGFPNDYLAKEIIESGDSGGPVYVGTGASRKIVAVNSGAGGGTEVLARVDLYLSKIQSVINANP